ncbi:TonB-dependent receptor [Novosphingobium beihaiensis]|uniref:TonB-dependent receptor n=1 Tax=Novosphingobium beihaiensis TaxID=2930389 RepID=A0ABT0BLB9_9SPHN|nr:TonB-dependent receptor [Novosphingobium beihaiensis]MCJ2185519.1 TonB-dependent receptor [Novosphingobium beihaiensis]
MKLHHRTILLAASALGGFTAAPAMAQSVDQGSANDIIVTAQRIEQRLQDVPISITVYNQEQLSNQNVTSAKDLATFTPGLQVNSRYGSDSTNFSIRGFTQEQRTSATVGVYFADVVALRGSGATFGGDGAGPGALFDLQNIQVLKGPQGTLQGRNVTGGAVLLVPQKPTDLYEGYVEGGLGNYDMRRLQAVINVPLADTFKVRLGMDHMERDGYLNNISSLGDGSQGNHGMGDVDYWAFRLSTVAELTPDLENYTIFTYGKSKSNGNIPKIISCSDSITSQTQGILTRAQCEAQMERESGHSPWTVENRIADSFSQIEQWQIINTTTWVATDNLTVKNITSYGEFRQKLNLDLFGSYFPSPYLFPDLTNPDVTSPGQVTGFAYTHSHPVAGYTNAQSSFVEELRFQGNLGDKLNWQAGAYMELNNPLNFSGVQTATFTACTDIDTLDCAGFVPGFSLGTINNQLSKTKFSDYALYGQASYKITSALSLTAGLRYTWDKTDARIRSVSVYPWPLLGQNLPGLIAFCANQTAPGAGTLFDPADRYDKCEQHLVQKSSAPTWTLGLEYQPTPDILAYAKWSRGYRAGGLSLFGPDSAPGDTKNLQPYKQEKVDAYEVGAKTSWHGAIPGSFNLAGYYNKFSDQQLLLGAIIGTRPNALVANAGKSRIWGIDADLNVRPFEGMNIAVSYAYLNTKLQAFTSPDLGSSVVLTPPEVGGPIPNSQPHKLNISANYTLPLDESIGKVTLGATWVYTAGYQAVASSCPGVYDPTTSPPANVGCFDGTQTFGYVDSVTGAYTNDAINAISGRPNTSIAGVDNVNPDGGRIPHSYILNLNATWENIGGLPVDISAFATNITNKVTYVSLNDNTSRSFRSALLGEPRMYGIRLKLKFGQ